MFLTVRDTTFRPAAYHPGGPLESFEHLLVAERQDLIMLGGRNRLYRLPNGYGLSAIDSPGAYRFAYAWEFAVLEPDPDHATGFGDVVFDTPLTASVKVCRSEEEAAAFLAAAVAWAEATP